MHALWCSKTMNTPNQGSPLSLQITHLAHVAGEVPQGTKHFSALRGLILPPGRPYPPLPPQLFSHFPTILGFASLPSTEHKVFILSVIEEAGLRDIKTYTATSTETLGKLLYDSSPLVVAHAVRALTVLFRKVCGFATLFPQFPIKAWHSMQHYTTEVLTTSPAKSVSYSAIKFSETVLLSFSSSPGRASADHFTLETLNLPTTVPNVSVTASALGEECHQVADCISGIALNSADADAVMVATGVLSSVGRRRPSLLNKTMGPLLTLAARLDRLQERGMGDGQCRSIAIVLRLHLNAFGKTVHGKSRQMKKKIIAAVGSIGVFTDRVERKRGREENGENGRPTKRTRWARIVLPSVEESARALQYFIKTMSSPALVDFVIDRIMSNIPAQVPISEVKKSEGGATKSAETKQDLPEIKKEVEITSQGRKRRRTAPPVIAPKLSGNVAIKLGQYATRSVLLADKKAATSGAKKLRIELLGRLLPMLCQSYNRSSEEFVDATIQWIAADLKSRFRIGIAWLYGECVRSLRESLHSEYSADDSHPLNAKIESVAAEGEPKTNAMELEKFTLKTDQNNVSGIEIDKTAEHKSSDVANEGQDTAPPMGEDDGDDEFNNSEVVGEGASERYDNLFEVLEKQFSATDPSGLYLGSLYLQAPILPKSCITRVTSSLENPATSNQTLRLAKALLLQRPTARTWLLPLVVERAVHSDSVVRGPVIRLIASSLFGARPSALGAEIETFALKKLEKVDAESEEDALPLLFALVGSAGELLTKVVNLYQRASLPTKERILSGIPQTASELGPGSPHILDLVKNTDETIVDLVLRLVQGAVKSSVRNKNALNALVDAVSLRYEKDKDVRFLLPVLKSLPRPQVVKLVPELLGDDFHLVATSITPSIVSPLEILSILHKLPFSLKAEDAINTCLHLQSVFTQEVVAISLDQLVTTTNLSPMLAKTVIQAIKVWPRLQTSALDTIATALVQQSIWKNETLWKVWIEFCEQIGDGCMRIVGKLPSKVLDDLLSRSPVILELIRSAIGKQKKKKIPAKYRKWILKK